MVSEHEGELWDLDGLSSAELTSLIEQAREALPAALQREQDAATSAQQQLQSLATQLEAQLPALATLAQTKDEDMTHETRCRALRTLAAVLAQVTELARQSVIIGAAEAARL